MKVLLPLITLAYLASAQDCPDLPLEPLNCGTDELACPGGVDGNGCMMPDSCIYMKGNLINILRES